MGDVIIAVVPAPGHEHLIAEGPMGERPALLVLVDSGLWSPMRRGLLSHDGRRALVLHAPGDPRLGMVRLRAALGLNDRRVHTEKDPHRWVGFVLSDRIYGDEVYFPREVVWGLPDDVADIPGSARDAYALAHLAKARGLVAEVLVLEVTRD